MTPRLIESRRLTGANLQVDDAGAVLEIALDTGTDVGSGAGAGAGAGAGSAAAGAAGVARQDPGDEPAGVVPAAEPADAVLAAWERELTPLLAAVGWDDAVLGHRRHAAGLTLAFTAPVDVLYAACDLHELAWARVVTALGGDVAGSFAPSGIPAPDPVAGDAAVKRIVAAIREEAEPALPALADAAAQHGVTLLWDDDEVSLGLGRHARTWPRGALPDPGGVRWGDHGDVPVVLVTGTNGKSTTVRMLSAVLDAHALATGSTSTDGIVVAGTRVEQGDWSGPGGARTLLRDHRVGAAVLEVARGGLLRRGLPVPRADAAIVTNIAEDHLGEYGVHDLDDLAATKLLVGRATRDSGVLVLSADDARLRAHAPTDQAVAWTSQDPDHPVVAAAVADGGRAWVVDGTKVLECTRDGQSPLLDAAQVPATLGGAARHNVANVLGVTALARSLGVPGPTIAAALAEFRSDATDNPGRANLFRVGGATALVDFAHNPHGMTAILDTARRLDADRLIVHLSQAGDRSDAAIAALTRAVMAAGPELVIASETAKYLRGRAPGEVPRVIRDGLLAAGADAEQVLLAGSPPEGVRMALDRARPGDLLCLMVLTEADAVRGVLDAAGAVPTRLDG